MDVIMIEGCDLTDNFHLILNIIKFPLPSKRKFLGEIIPLIKEYEKNKAFRHVKNVFVQGRNLLPSMPVIG